LPAGLPVFSLPKVVFGLPMSHFPGLGEPLYAYVCYISDGDRCES